ncbi:peptidoglycan/LPS O-acetylase OafA/YrhL [Arthrobacter pigmenti]|uniref:Peptidoglycan/LPS O-acetylase OafA/YrhL n=1 Tax=Arthrobacter pigmenti TaxID=271432 RepID=A0A846RMS0_9MICC|nr:acyltransferase [Arthrobacter pigmenti]NJC22910.1 peptidoglycan/LPS O-acetylase OafA/YrhL [Arthrobacter pigmenti]
MEQARFVLGFRQGIDGFRVVAILLLMVGHSNWEWFLDDGGLVSVNLFFTLSGFLVTVTLMEEWRRDGSIDVKSFYARRAIRLYPALIAVTVVGLAMGVSVLGAVLVLSYLSNFAAAMEFDIHPLTHTWSLAAQEQFVLLAPLTLLLVRGRWRIWAGGAIALVMGIWIWRFSYWTSLEESLRWVYNGPGRIDAILIGCLLAMWFYHRGEWKPNRPIVVASWVFLLAYASGFWPPGWSYFTVGMVALQGATAVAVCWAVVQRGTWAANPFVRHTAKISYGLYVWHYPVFRAPAVQALPQPLESMVGWGTAFFVASISYYLLERPISRKFGGRFRRRTVQLPAASLV